MNSLYLQTNYRSYKDSVNKPISNYTKEYLKKSIFNKYTQENISYDNFSKTVNTEPILLSKSPSQSKYITIPKQNNSFKQTNFSSKLKIIHINPKFSSSITKCQTPQKNKTKNRIIISPLSNSKKSILNSSNPLRYPNPNELNHKQRGSSFQSKTKQEISVGVRGSSLKKEIKEIRNKIHILEKELHGNQMRTSNEDLSNNKIDIKLYNKKIFDLENEKDGLNKENKLLKEENVKLKLKLNAIIKYSLSLIMLKEEKDKDNNECTWKDNNCVNREQSIKIIDNCLTVDEKGLDGIINVIENQNEYLNERLQELETKINLIMVANEKKN